MFTGYKIGKNAKDIDIWNKFISTTYNSNYRHNLRFAEIKNSKYRRVETFIFLYNDCSVAGCHYVIKHSKLKFVSISEIKEGIIFTQKPTSELILFIIEHFNKWSLEQKADIIEINSWIPKTINNEITDEFKIFDECLITKGFAEIQPGKDTYWLNLELSEEDLIKKMNSGTKRNIKKGIKSEISIKKYNCFNQEMVKEFWLLYKQHFINKKLQYESETTFVDRVKILLEDQNALLIVLKFQETIVNISLVGFAGMSMYYHGAMNDDYTILDNCPSPGHLAQWIMITEMKKRGFKLYDMAFCPGAEPFSEHPNYGIWRFKHGFGGKHVKYSSKYSKVVSPLKNSIVNLLRRY